MAKSEKFSRDFYLDNALGTQNKVRTWATGKHDPKGAYLDQLCDLLSASPAYLYGAEPGEIRAYLERVVRRELGDAEADALVAIGRLRDQNAPTEPKPPRPPAVIEPWMREAAADDGTNAKSGARKRRAPADASKPRRG